MYLFENKARNILSQFRMVFPRWFVASNEEEAANAAIEINKKVEIEPLILTDQRDFKTAAGRC